VQIAVKAGQGEILYVIQAAVLAWDDVLDMEFADLQRG